MQSALEPEKKRSIQLRLARAEGQLRGIQKLIEQDSDCELIAQQLAATRKALDKAFFAMVACMIEQGDMPSDDVANMLTKYA
jgi:CsoR family transcriptional regulator, copper-sensing transcriptional repressor